MVVRIKTKYINTDVKLHFRKYGNGSIAIQGFSFGEPEFTATVALDEVPPDNHVFLKGWSENEGLPAALVNAGIVKLTGRTIPTGFCEALEAEMLISTS